MLKKSLNPFRLQKKSPFLKTLTTSLLKPVIPLERATSYKPTPIKPIHFCKTSGLTKMHFNINRFNTENLYGSFTKSYNFCFCKSKSTVSVENASLVLRLTSLVDKEIDHSLALLDSLNDSIARFIQQIKPNVDKSLKTRFDTYGFQLERHCQRLIRRFSKRQVLKFNHRSVKTYGRFTVIRSPFVFKKTREQFGLQKKSCIVKLTLPKWQQQLFLQYLCLTKLPAELRIISFS